jgi:hypothetical protein
MTKDAGGGGGSGTYWYGIHIEDMWAWVNRDLTPHYEQATGWKKASELTGLYYQRLQAFRDKLAVAWNPKTSPAAEAYLTKLDDLIKAVRDVDDVSGRNYQSSVDIPNAIFEAKSKLEPIYNAYKAAETDYNKSQSPTPQRTPSPSPSGSNPAQTMSTKFDQAVGVMYQLSGDLSKAQAGLGKPAPYVPPVLYQDDHDHGTPPAPVIPPVVPMSPPPAPAMPSGPTSPMPGPKAPDLTGLQPPTSPPISGTPPTPLVPGPTGPGPVVGPTMPTGPLPSSYPPGGVIEPPPPPGGRPIGPFGANPARGGLPGGIIGQAPPGGRGAAPGGARPNPVGGMIGSGASTGRGAGGPGAPGAAGRGGGRGMMGPMGVGGHAGQSGDEEGEHFDPDTLWDVAQGVAPVLDSPGAQGPIDPGPAIGLSR